MNPYVMGAAVLLLVGTYAAGRIEQHKIDLGQQARDAHIAQLSAEAASKAAAEAINAIEVKHVTLRQELTKEIVERPVYRDCQHTDDAWRVLNDAYVAPEDRPRTDRSVSEAGSAH